MKPLVFIADYIYALWLLFRSRLSTAQPSTNQGNNGLVILLPGVYENWYYFRRLKHSLVTHGFAVLHADDIYKGISIAEDSKALSNFIKDHSLENVSLIGHSSGGLTAVSCLQTAPAIKRVVAIATPFSGVANGHIVRTSKVRELMPGSDTITSVEVLSPNLANKVISIYPSYDNQIWSKSGSILKGAKNIRLNAKGHHLILRSDGLAKTVVEALAS